MSGAGREYGEPWRAGRRDMVSTHGDGCGPFKAIYASYPDGKAHHVSGHELPMLIAEAYGEEIYDCRDLAERIAACVNACAGIPADKLKPEVFNVLTNSVRDAVATIEARLDSLAFAAPEMRSTHTAMIGRALAHLAEALVVAGLTEAAR